MISIFRKLTGIFLAVTFLAALTAFGAGAAETTGDAASAAGTAAQEEQADAAAGEDIRLEFQAGSTAAESAAVPGAEKAQDEAQAAEKNGDIMILYTSDIHCGVDQSFSLVGLQQIRDALEAQGYTTILVDNGDAVQGEPIGLLSDGEIMIDLMNRMQYDVAIPGNHEFDYGMDQFMKLTQMAHFPYISCNFTKEGELVFAPYIIKEAAGKKIAFVGVTTPQTIIDSTPSFFQNEKGEFIYSFYEEDRSGEALYEAVQKAVDEARGEGADYVYVLGHMGMYDEYRPWTYADVISHTNGIDVFLDGHSHDTEQVVMKNKDGVEVPRSACGTKMECIGYSCISAEKGIEDTGIWTWRNSVSVPQLFGLRNEMTDTLEEALKDVYEMMGDVVGESAVSLLTTDPVEKDSDGLPVRMVRRAETNLGDFCADAYRFICGADIGLAGGGSVRESIKKGKITYGDILTVNPFSDDLYVVEATGQQILDALEWGSKDVPGEFGGFLQVSGMSYEVDVSVQSTCTIDENGFFKGVEGARRVKNVTVAGRPIDPDATYTVAGNNYLLMEYGDGNTAFRGAEVVKDRVTADNQALLDYITETLGGTIHEEYRDPYGQGRIVILDEDQHP